MPGTPAPFVPVDHDPPVDRLGADFPIRLTTGRRLDSYNTGVQTAGYRSPRRRGETIDLSPEDAARLRIHDGERVRIVSRRGAVEEVRHRRVQGHGHPGGEAAPPNAAPAAKPGAHPHLTLPVGLGMGNVAVRQRFAVLALVLVALVGCATDPASPARDQTAALASST